jgi:DNA repair exonuclease SbcCD ATPase subunit
MDQQKRYEHLLAEKDHSCSLMLDEKDKQYKALKESIEQKQIKHKENLSKKDQLYINQIKEIESKYQEQTQEMLKTHKDQLQKIQHQLKKDEEMKLITDRARLEAKEKEILVKYEKKMKKYAEKIEQVMEQYRLKELKITGALEEARREIIHLQANFDAKEESYREELMLKDRRLIQIQQRLDTVDDLAKVADTWRETAKDLASIVIRTCATVEDLPPELWSSTTPGLFTTVWDDLQHLKASHASSTTGKLPRNDDIAETYAKKRKEYVMASRILMSKCLRFSKVSYYVHTFLFPF